MAKKIALIIDDISGSGGVERMTVFLANQFSFYGHAVSVITMTKAHTEDFYPLSGQVKLYSLQNKKLFNLSKLFSEKCFDYIITMSMGRLSFKISLLRFFVRFPGKLFLSEHNSYQSTNVIVRALKLIGYNLADKLILLTEHDKNILQQKVKTEIVVFRNPSFYDSPENFPAEKEKLVIAVGRLTEQKNFPEAIRIWHKLKNKQGWKFFIIGNGTEEKVSDLHKLVKELKIQDSVFILPATNKLNELFLKASIIVMTSRFEGLPLVLIESKTFGLSAISYRCKTGPEEIINDGEDGFLIAPGDFNDFVNKLDILLAQPSLLFQQQNKAFTNSVIFSKDKIIKDWLDLLN
jgi:amylovoran biosynthesis glycosyltransferase AmsD